LARYNKFNLNIVCKLKAASFLPIIGANLNIVYQFAKQSGPSLPICQTKRPFLPIKERNIVPENFFAKLARRKGPKLAPLLIKALVITRKKSTAYLGSNLGTIMRQIK